MEKFCRNICLLVCVFICLLFLGCSNYNELEKYIHVFGIYIDKEEYTDQFIVTFETIDTEFGENRLIINTVESRGKTIHDAIRDSISFTGKAVNMSHCQSVFIGQSAIKDGIIPVIDLMYRDVEVRSDMFLVLTKEENSREILKSPLDKNEIIELKMPNAYDWQKNTGKYMIKRIFEIVDDMQTEGIDPIICNVENFKTDYGIVPKLKGAYVFNGDKLSGYLNEEECKTLNILINKKFSGTIAGKTSDGATITYEIKEVKSKIKPKIIDNKISMDINLDILGVLSEIESGNKEYTSKEERYYIKRYIEKKIGKKISDLLYRLQHELNSDVIGFGKIIDANENEKWEEIKKDWSNEFKNIESNISCEVFIKSSSLIRGVLKVNR